jgi:ABC-type multidrug transport system fused ATPase/permease subunit
MAGTRQTRAAFRIAPRHFLMTILKFPVKPKQQPRTLSLFDLYRQVWLHAAGERMRFLFAMTILTLSQVVKLAVPWFAAQAIDSVQGNRDGRVSHAAVMMGAIVLVYCVAWAMHGPGRVLERHVGLRVRASMSDALMEKLARAPLAWHEQQHSADLQQRIQQSSHALYDFTQGQFMYLQNAVNLVGPLVALTMLSRLTGAVALGGVVLIALVITRFDRVLMGLSLQENSAERRYNAGMLDVVQNIKTVLALRLQGATRKLVENRLLQAFAPTRTSIEVNEAKWCAVDLLSIALVWGLVAFQAWRMHQASAATGALLLGSIFMVYQYAQQASGVIGTFAANFQSFSSIKASVASADPILEAHQSELPPLRIDRDWQSLELSGISYRYPHPSGKSLGISEATVSLKRGQHLALVGPSGSGKSTLLHILAGLYQASGGELTVDQEVMCSARDLSAYAMLVPQETEVFEATIRENLTFGADYSEEQIERALYLSVFDEVVANLPQGLDTPISERGFNLSGGQRQRLSLARGLLAASQFSILLLDEPTSALDQATEARFFQRLNQAMPDVCVIASVHRLSTLPNFDQVMLMVDGTVIDCGTTSQLQERQPLMRRMSGLDSAIPQAA